MPVHDLFYPVLEIALLLYCKYHNITYIGSEY